METLPPAVRSMYDPGTYPHPVEDIRLVQTHISWVFLTGAWAYKIKKPVDFGFLDFTTLERREHFCRRELELNRRFAPEIYVDVVPLCFDGHRYRIQGKGDMVESCLRMRQFREDDLLLHRVRQRRFDPAWMDLLAEDIAAFHEQARGLHDIQAGRRLFEHLRDNIRVARERVPHAVDEATVTSHARFIQRSEREKFGELDERERQGMVRDVHGDLHLRNLVLFGGRPTPFDCIEFSDEFRCIDVLNDVAFLVMDCEAQHIMGAGYRFLSRYLEHTGDHAGLGLLPLYLFYRATVRAKVACLQSGQQRQQKRLYDEARAYFRLASSYIEPQKPSCFAIGGLSGSGKSHLAIKACDRRRTIVVRSDATRKRLAKARPDLPLYGGQMTALTYEQLIEDALAAARAGFDVVMDATFLERTWRELARERFRRHGLALQFFWLDVPEEILRRRIRERMAAKRDVSDADLSVLEMQLARYKRPEEGDIRFLQGSHAWPET